jgi:polar amino acid transport system permease protein
MTSPGYVPAVTGEHLVIVPTHRPGRWVATAIGVLLVALAARSVATNPNFEWPVVGQYLFADIILSGLLLTLWLTVAAMLIGIVLGMILAVMQLSSNPLLPGFVKVFLWFFRGTPVLVQLIFWYNLAALYPTLSIGVPFGPTLAEASANDLITPWTAALLGLGLHEAAYMCEIIRGGLLSVEWGQSDAARALGMRQTQTLRRIVLPQAMRFILPPTGNQTIGMLKTTSLVSVIALSDLLYSAQRVYSRTYETIPLLLVACAWYLVATSALSLGQKYIERYFSRGQHAFHQ